MEKEDFPFYLKFSITLMPKPDSAHESGKQILLIR